MLRKDNREEGGTFLVGYKNRLFKIEGDLQVGENICNYDSCGCGEEFALGSLFMSKDLNISTEEKIIKALETAEYFSAGVSKPFKVIKLGGKNENKN